MIFENYPVLGRVDFYDFYCQFLVNVTTYITDHNKFDVKFIIYLLSKLKKLNYKLSIFYENKLNYTRIIIYKLEPPAQSFRSCCRLSVNNYNCVLLLWIILKQSIKLTKGSIMLYSLDSILYYVTLNLVCP